MSQYFQDDPGRTPGLLGPENEQTRRVYSVNVFTEEIMRKADGSLWPSGCTKYDIKIGDPLFRWAPELGVHDGVFSLLNNIVWWGGEWKSLTPEGKRAFLTDNLRFVGIAAESLPAHHQRHPQQEKITANRVTVAALRIRGGAAKSGNLIEWFLPPSGNVEFQLIMWFRKWSSPTIKNIIEIGEMQDMDAEEEGENDGSEGFGIRAGYRNLLAKRPTKEDIESFLSSAFGYMRFKKHSVVGTLLSSEMSGPYHSVDIH